MGETIGQRIQRLRQDAGLSQAALAKESRVPIGSLRNWEQDRRIPALDAAARLAKAMGVSLDALAGDSQADLTPAEPALSEPWPKGRPRKDEGQGGETAESEKGKVKRKGAKKK